MNGNRFSKKVILVYLIFISTVIAQDNSVEAIINTSETHEPISKFVYGQFIEHIGDIINDNLWAEMLDDRKFYYPVLEEEPEPTFFRRLRARRWLVIGPLDQIMMDSGNAFTGEHSPRIQLDQEEVRGIQQFGLAIKKGKSYAGRIVLSADQDTEVKVSLIYGEGENHRDTKTIKVRKGPYLTHKFTFKSGGDTTNACIEISAIGNGTLRIGAVSLMPADNVKGYRKEVIALLKSLKSGVYRFPGGNFVSAHEWRDAIGDRDRRPPVFDPVWHAVQPNDVGIDEFMILCDLIDVEPYITVNAGFGDAWSAAQLVEYANGSVDTPMGKLRAQNAPAQKRSILSSSYV